MLVCVSLRLSVSVFEYDSLLVGGLLQLWLEHP